MLTYQLHSRHIVVPSGNGMSFPNKVKIELKLSPANAFGTKNEYGRTVIKGHEATISIDANNGKFSCKSNPPLKPLNVEVTNKDSVLKLKGDLLTYEFECPSLPALNGMLTMFKFVYPAILNLEFSDPPIILHIHGDVGGVNFKWEHKPEEWLVSLRTIEQINLEKHIDDSFEHLQLFNGTNNRRLAAALSYFHLAVRLSVCGDSPWEFMAETILNYCKSIEILLVSSENTKDDIRKQLKKLGYSEEEIEGDFIPLIILRSFVDVAHPKVALYQPEDLRILYHYLSHSENVIREFLARILQKINSNEYILKQDEELTLNSKDRKGMNRLLLTMKSRL